MTDISKHRLDSQQIVQAKAKTVKEIVGWMGAMQAQDYAMAKWAVGVRLSNSTEKYIEDALDNGEILRTHLLRPTWHLVSADDIYWLLELTAPQIKASMKSRYKQLGLTDAVFGKSNATIEKALSKGEHLTREELVAELQNAKIKTDGNRASHLLFWSELDKIICSGSTQNGKQTYALLEERIPKPSPISREEALAKIAQRYFTSHGPATLQDFVWWSGLSVGDAKRGLEAVKNELVSVTIDSQTYWLSDSFASPKTNIETLYLLPAYDEFIISYKDRSASLPYAHQKKAVSNNGLFRPVIVLNGKVIGIWRRSFKKNKVIVEFELFTQIDEKINSLIEERASLFGYFLDKEVEVVS